MSGQGLGVNAAPLVHSSLSGKRQVDPVEEDPCKTLGRLLEPEITYSAVRKCYENIPYNMTEANSVLSTLYTFFKDYYIFLDAAMLDNHPKPFTTAPVDMLNSLDILSRKSFKGDFEFHTSVETLVGSLNDAHANYLPSCYKHYLYIQPFDLYAPVIDGAQTIRILRDNSGNNLDGCEIVTIDGVKALDAIQEYSDKFSGFSKDAGVRLNKALSSNYFDAKTKQWGIESGIYTTRANLPESPTLSYHINCPVTSLDPKGYNDTVDVNWSVFRLVSWKEFDSTESFLRNNCYLETDPIEAQPPGKKRSTNIKKQDIHQTAIEMTRQDTIHSTPMSKNNIQKRQYSEGQVATPVSNGSTTAFYQLIKRPDIGVVVIPTHSVDLKTEPETMELGFKALSHAGVSNIILDLTGNGGGYVSFAYDLVDWMFPIDNQTSIYQSDLRTSSSVKALAQADMEDEDFVGYYNPGSFSSITTNEVYETNFFLEDQLIKRANRRLAYTPRVLMDHALGAFEMEMPWQHDAERIVILTDGTCGSACGMSMNRLKNTHGVKSYAVGGRVGEELSLFSFPGASVYSLDNILNSFDDLSVDTPMQRMNYKGIYRVPILEFYQEGESTPIEHNSKLYKADFHLDYTPTSARQHELLWEIVANNHWPKEGIQSDDPSIEKH
ncbi:hypothetical protein BGZ76_007611 [Entomortierella beljakovae]|nr:hypothetical protein BGZ76_007611 [Entomortierella beljakovae]